ncbi:MAG: hypothetical protein KM296_06205 [Brockia lithotrophica]|nr:hypothetical protein [Brockia lithotrophica]
MAGVEAEALPMCGRIGEGKVSPASPVHVEVDEPGHEVRAAAKDTPGGRRTLPVGPRRTPAFSPAGRTAGYADDLPTPHTHGSPSRQRIRGEDLHVVDAEIG